MTVTSTGGASRALPWLFLIYAAASSLHFAHNAEYLARYPHLPSSWSRADIYLAWCVVSAAGILGYVVYLRGRRLIGLALLALYASLGFAGLLHYTRAPFGHHTTMMNATILAEAAAAASLLANVVVLAARR